MDASLIQIIKQNSLCVLSTCGSGSTNASLMQYVPADNCRFICMMTPRDRKYVEIMENPQVSLLIDNRASKSSVYALTVFGKAEVLEKGTWDEGAAECLYAINADLKEMAIKSDCVMLSMVVESTFLATRAFDVRGL
jgi:nitroimidazol reductase NimA-like FMN-containing flavoprotein (pyridoxamine 5'-phosphate oxidase superfamily)